MKLTLGITPFLVQFETLSSNDLALISDLVQTQTFRKGEFLIQEGDVCRKLFFIKSGMLRSFFTKPNGDEMTYCLTFGNNLMTALSSFLTGLPTHENLQALTNLEVEVIEKDKLEAVTEGSINWQQLEKQLIAEQYIELEKRMLSIQRLSAKERYDELVKDHAELLKYIPLKHLASFLNITPRHLTRLRGEKHP